jgi:tRNA(Glu) U13 pseudouridine synthase TruD
LGAVKVTSGVGLYPPVTLGFDPQRFHRVMSKSRSIDVAQLKQAAQAAERSYTMEIKATWPGSREEKQLRAADRTCSKREALAPLKADLRWLRKHINAASDPITQKYIADTKAKIAAVERGRRP